MNSGTYTSMSSALLLLLIVSAGVAHAAAAAYSTAADFNSAIPAAPANHCSSSPCNITFTLSHSRPTASTSLALFPNHKSSFEWLFAAEVDDKDPLQQGAQASLLVLCWPPDLNANYTMTLTAVNEASGQSKVLASVTGPSNSNWCARQRPFNMDAGWKIQVKQSNTAGAKPQNIANLAWFMSAGNMCAEEGAACSNGATCSRMFPNIWNSYQLFFQCECAPGWIGHQCNHRPNFCSYTAADGSFFDFSGHTPDVLTSYYGVMFRDNNTELSFAMCETFNPYTFPADYATCNSSYSLCRYNDNPVGTPLGTWGGPGGAQWQLIDEKHSASGVRIVMSNGPALSGAGTTKVTMDFVCGSAAQQASARAQPPPQPPRVQAQGPLIHPSAIKIDELNNAVIIVAHNGAVDVQYDFFCPLGKNPCLSNPCKNGGSCFAYVDDKQQGVKAVLKHYCVCPPDHTGENCELPATAH